jgi:hypothetical protein
LSRPWFRMYSEFISDPKVQLLAFEDQRHFVGLLCLKASGTLDSDVPSSDFRDRMIAKALGLSLDAAIEAKRRLIEVGLILEDWQPKKWSERQYAAKGLPDGESLEGYRGYVYFIGPKNGTPLKIGYSRNPWARVKELQTAATEQMFVVATIKTTEPSEIDVHKLFKEERVNGEWFERSAVLDRIINDIKDGAIASIGDLIATTKQLRSYDPTTQIQNRAEQSKRPAKRSRRVPPDFSPDLGFAESVVPDIDASAEAAKFRDWEFKTPRSDWDAVWRNWVTTCKETGRYAKRGGGIKWM